MGVSRLLVGACTGGFDYVCELVGSQRLRSTAHAYPIALRVARGQRPYSGTASSGARRALSTMERAGIAEHHGRGDWTISEPLLRCYLATRP